MPLYKTLNVDKETTVKIWKITETFNELSQNIVLGPESLARVKGMKSEIHQRGFLSVRQLLAAFGYADADLYYDDNGKPHLHDGKHISITHSFIFSAIIISNNSVGIDIEKQRPKIEHISKKFIDYEFQYLKANEPKYIRQLTIIWCIKESLYKQFAKPGLSFKQHILVIPFTIEDQETASWIDYDEDKYRYQSNYFEFEGFTCAYVIP